MNWTRGLHHLGLAAVLGTFVSVAFPATPTHAQPAFEFEIFEPKYAQGVNLLNLAKTDVMQHLWPTAGIFFHYIKTPLKLVLDDGNSQTEIARLTDNQAKLELNAGIGFFDLFDIGIMLPMIVTQGGDDLDIVGQPGQNVNGFALADMRVEGKIRLLHPDKAAGFGIALGGVLYLPTGDTATLNSYGKVRGKPYLVADWRSAKEDGFGIVANLGVEFQPKVTIHNLELNDNFHYGLGLEIPLGVKNLQLLTTWYGQVPFDKNVDPTTGAPLSDMRTTPMELDAALQFRVGPWVMNAGGGAGLTEGMGAPKWRLFGSFSYVPRTNDTDGDGILDHEDDCPLNPEDFDGFEDEDGCPDEDNDKDGVLDVDDGEDDGSGFGKCRDIPEDRDGFQDDDGCPDPDNDGDGILDVNDGKDDGTGFGACRDQPEDKDGFQDEDGCPDPDNDGDGILDRDDGHRDETGKIDRDDTGFGKCRDQPETVNDYLDDDGCPDEKPQSVIVTAYQIQILEKVHFDYNKDTIKPVSFPLLNEVARVILEHPQLTKIMIEGHTDHRGSHKYNDKLSDARAASVRKYLVSKGVASNRLKSFGHGERKPLVKGREGRREAGMAKNRRVEMKIIEVEGKPHSPENPVIIRKARRVDDSGDVKAPETPKPTPAPSKEPGAASPTPAPGK